MVVALEPRVTRLEYLMAEQTENVTRLVIEMREFKQEMREFKDEMSEFKEEMLAFKDEMREFKDEMSEFKDEMSEFKDEMSEFKDEMSEFKDEMLAFKEESRRESREMNRRWGELANKMGTLAEDLVAPSIPRILSELIGCPASEIEVFSVRSRRRRADGVTQEYDVMAGCWDVLLINETKSRLRPQDVEDFVALLNEARSFMPEFAMRRIVGVLASFYVDGSLVRHGERQGLVMLGAADGIMEVLNEPSFSPRFF